MKNIRLIDDIRVNINVPNIVSLPLGGGTVIHVNENDGSVRVGPDSVGYRLDQEALAFGGQTITATDVALAAALISGVSFNSLKFFYRL
jgi:N-methylhydantoinase A/oxoprolinase/acetone carboxylase beta subunit